MTQSELKVLRHTETQIGGYADITEIASKHFDSTENGLRVITTAVNIKPTTNVAEVGTAFIPLCLSCSMDTERKIHLHTFHLNIFNMNLYQENR
jgi:hypothetical protein